ncbi:MAG: hypothetical protein R2788_08245 [Saprospiraceae bacterium]
MDGIREGIYLIVINESGACGGGSNTATSNGFPAITCTGGASCGSCGAGTLTTTDTLFVPGQSFTLEVETDTVPNGGRGWYFSAAQGGAGALQPSFVLPNQPDSAAYDSDLNGALSFNGLDELGGMGYLRVLFIQIQGDSFNSICDFTEGRFTDRCFLGWGEYHNRSR